MGEGEQGYQQQTPLLTDLLPLQLPPSPSSDGHYKRTGTTWTATAHIITGVIGSGVLSLAWSTAQLGWIAGPVAMIIFAGITIVSAFLLCDCYRSPQPETGLIRHRSYMEAVKFNLGTLLTAIAHILTGVIGSGVLSISWSVAQLGWIAGPLSMLCLAMVTYVSSFLLSDCYRHPDPVTGARHHSYMDAVKTYLGRKQTWLCGLLQILSMYGFGIAYVITTSISMRAIQRSNCFHKEGHQAPCAYGDTIYMLLFGVIQVVCSQIPDFRNMEWLSILASIMSFSYASIGFALGFAKVIGNGRVKGSIAGVHTTTTAQKVWKVSQALGDIAFAYPYSIILIEIQDTLKSPPPENKTMKKASMTAILITTFFYLCCGCFGYAAFGDETPGNLLTGFGFYEPYWLIDFANACIVVHLVGGYQVYSQPVFAVVEKWIAEKFPSNGFVNNSYTIKIPLLPGLTINLLRLCFRTCYVLSTTGLAMLFPYFNQVLGVLGALNFWPLTIYFPVEMYFVQRKIVPWTRSWIILQSFSMFCLLVSLVALVGSVEGLISAKLS